MGCVILFYWDECYFDLHMHQMGPQGPTYFFDNQFYSKNARKARLCSPISLLEYLMILLEVEWIHKKLWILFLLNFYFIKFVFIVSPGTYNWNKITISCELRPLQVKLWYHMFCRMKMEEYMESMLSSIFWVKLVAKNKCLGPRGPNTWAVSAVW